MRFQVVIRLKSGVLDVQGKAIEAGLKDKHFNAIGNVRVGRVVELDIDGVPAEQAHAQVVEVCKLVLANPVIEDYEIKEVV